MDWPSENRTDENPIKRELIALHRGMVDMSVVYIDQSHPRNSRLSWFSSICPTTFS